MSCDACKRIPVLTGSPCSFCGRLNVEAALALVKLRRKCERDAEHAAESKAREEALRDTIERLGKEAADLAHEAGCERAANTACGVMLTEAQAERDRLKGELADARMALKECVAVMRIQEERSNERFHLSAEAFMPMWDAAIAAADALLLAAPSPAESPTFEQLVDRVGPLPTTGLAGASPAESTGAPETCACGVRLSAGYHRRGCPMQTAAPPDDIRDRVEWSLINRIAEAKAYALGQIKRAERVIGSHLSEMWTRFADHERRLKALEGRMDKAESVVRHIDLEHAEMCPQHLGLGATVSKEDPCKCTHDRELHDPVCYCGCTKYVPAAPQEQAGHAYVVFGRFVDYCFAVIDGDYCKRRASDPIHTGAKP